LEQNFPELEAKTPSWLSEYAADYYQSYLDAFKREIQAIDQHDLIGQERLEKYAYLLKIVHSEPLAPLWGELTECASECWFLNMLREAIWFWSVNKNHPSRAKIKKELSEMQKAFEKLDKLYVNLSREAKGVLAVSMSDALKMMLMVQESRMKHYRPKDKLERAPHYPIISWDTAADMKEAYQTILYHQHEIEWLEWEKFFELSSHQINTVKDYEIRFSMFRLPRKLNDENAERNYFANAFNVILQQSFGEAGANKKNRYDQVRLLLEAVNPNWYDISDDDIRHGAGYASFNDTIIIKDYFTYHI
jgi:hypothetical protein